MRRVDSVERRDNNRTALEIASWLLSNRFAKEIFPEISWQQTYNGAYFGIKSHAVS